METNVIHATEEFLRTEINKRDERIKQLEEHSARVTERDFRTAAALNAMSTSLHEWTMDNFENDNITEEQATELSEIGGFDLTKEVEAEVTVTYYITLQVPAGESAEDIVNDIDFESVSYNNDAITNISADVGNVDL